MGITKNLAHGDKVAKANGKTSEMVKGFTVTYPNAMVKYSHEDGRRLWIGSTMDGRTIIKWGISDDSYNYLMRGLEDDLKSRNLDIAKAISDYLFIFDLYDGMSEHSKDLSERFKKLSAEEQFVLLLSCGVHHNSLLNNMKSPVSTKGWSKNLEPWFRAFRKTIIDKGDKVAFCPLLLDLSA